MAERLWVITRRETICERANLFELGITFAFILLPQFALLLDIAHVQSIET
jgi:hypothetical protein